MHAGSTEFRSINSLGPQAGRVIGRQFDTIFRTVMRGPAVKCNADCFRYLTHEPHPYGNFAVVSDPTNCAATQTAIAPFQKLDVPSAVIYPEPVSQDVESLLQTSSYMLGETMIAMAVSIEALAPTSLPDGYRLVQVTSTCDDPAWCEAFATGYGLPRRVADDFGPRNSADLIESGKLQYFGIINNGAMVSTSMLFFEGGLAGVYSVSTLPTHRGKGLAAHATAHSLRQARSLGYTTGILQSSALGESVYRRLGFERFGSVPLYVHMPPGTSFSH